MPFPDPVGGGGGTHAALPDVTPDQHHAEIHAIDSADHTGVLVDGQIPAAIARDVEVVAEVAAHAAIEQAHGLEHADLFALGPNDHHAESHLIDGAAHTGSLAHTALDTVGPNDHHAAAHAIDGANHTGVLVDAQIPASIARDSELHAAIHDIDGANHDGFPGGTSTFLRADGVFAAPTAAAADPVYSPGSFTVATETGRYIPKRLNIAGSERVNVEGTGRLVIN